MKILFVGNSYTYYNDLPSLVEDLLNENGIAATVQSVTDGGRKLFENFEKDDKTSHDLRDLSAQSFDYLFIQEQSKFPITHFEQFKRGVLQTVKLIKPAVTVLYATWARAGHSPDLKLLNLTQSQMTTALDEAYGKLAKENGYTISRVGKCFQELALTAPDLELYDADGSHPSYAGSCVAAIMHYFAIVGNAPENCKSLNLATRHIDAIKEAAAHQSL